MVKLTSAQTTSPLQLNVLLVLLHHLLPLLCLFGPAGSKVRKSNVHFFCSCIQRRTRGHCWFHKLLLGWNATLDVTLVVLASTVAASSASHRARGHFFPRSSCRSSTRQVGWWSPRLVSGNECSCGTAPPTPGFERQTRHWAVDPEVWAACRGPLLCGHIPPRKAVS